MDRVIIIAVFTVSVFHLSTQRELALPLGIKECHPVPSPDKPQYLIGYGSLINEDSKGKTYQDTGINVPVNVSGFKRTWTAKGVTNVSLSTTYLGVDIDSKSNFNGVLFSVPNTEAIGKYDKREGIYCRVRVSSNDVRIVKGNISDNGTFPSDSELRDAELWVYVTSPTVREFPDEHYPIVMSYVDIFLGGCLQMERKYGLEGYAEQCITTTEGWQYPWVNDRIQPRRPWTYQPQSWLIDSLIAKNIPDHKSRLYLERFYVGRSVNGGESNLLSPILLTATTVAAIFH